MVTRRRDGSKSQFLSGRRVLESPPRQGTFGAKSAPSGQLAWGGDRTAACLVCRPHPAVPIPFLLHFSAIHPQCPPPWKDFTADALICQALFCTHGASHPLLLVTDPVCKHPGQGHSRAVSTAAFVCVKAAVGTKDRQRLFLTVGSGLNSSCFLGSSGMASRSKCDNCSQSRDHSREKQEEAVNSSQLS